MAGLMGPTVSETLRGGRLPELPPRPTQKRRVLLLLRAFGERGVCLADCPGDLSYTMRNRISELRADGFTIAGAVCRTHRHPSAVQRYTLTEEKP